jgi:hypothetical protein
VPHAHLSSGLADPDIARRRQDLLQPMLASLDRLMVSRIASICLAVFGTDLGQQVAIASTSVLCTG